MHFGTIILIGIAVNFDNLFLGLSCGMAKRTILWYHNLIIALISGLFGGISCAASHLIPEKFSTISALLGSIILFSSGVWVIVKGIKESDAVTECPLRQTTLREICLLSVALALNCFAVSLGMGMSDAPCFYLGLSMAAFSFMMVGIGNYIGKNVSCVIKSNRLDILSGILLIAIAIWEWFL